MHSGMMPSEPAPHDAGVLSNVPLFRGLDHAALAEVATHARRARAAAGRTFFREGERARLFYVLRCGRVECTQLSAEGHEVNLRRIGSGEPFGGVAALADNAIYPVTARAVEPPEADAWEPPAARWKKGSRFIVRCPVRSPLFSTCHVKQVS